MQQMRVKAEVKCIMYAYQNIAFSNCSYITHWIECLKQGKDSFVCI